MLLKIGFENYRTAYGCPAGGFWQVSRLVQTHYDVSTRRLIPKVVQTWFTAAASVLATSGV